VTTKANGDTFTNTWDSIGKSRLLASTTDGNSHTITYSYTARNQKSSVSYPGSTSESWTYDANGAVASHTDGRSYTTNYTLDHAGRLTGIDYPHDTDVSLTYDAAGRKTGMTDGSGTTGWTFDNANRVTQIAQPRVEPTL
jgi:YD repeat-containing protein